MLSRALLLVLSLLSSALSPPPPQQTAQTLQVIPLPKDGEVLVSFKFEKELTDDIRAAIRSGMTVKFVYKVDLMRSSTVWLDRKVQSAVVSASVRYDTLLSIYHYSRAIDGHIEFADTTNKEETAWSALTRDFARLPLFRGVTLEQNADYYVRVRANASPRNATFVWPWQGDDAMGFAKFTFIR